MIYSTIHIRPQDADVKACRDVDGRSCIKIEWAEDKDYCTHLLDADLTDWIRRQIMDTEGA